MYQLNWSFRAKDSLIKKRRALTLEELRKVDWETNISKLQKISNAMKKAISTRQVTLIWKVSRKVCFISILK